MSSFQKGAVDVYGSFFNQPIVYPGRGDDTQHILSSMDCVMHPLSPCSVFDHWSRDSRIMIIIKLIIHAKNEGKHPQNDAHS